MRIRALAAVIAGSLLASGTLPTQPAVGAGAAYQIDPVHSFVVWRIKHLDVGYVHGRFDKVSGSLTYDEANPAASSVEVNVDPASVDTGTQKRDDHLRTPDFFNVAQFPVLSFKSTSVKGVDATHIDVAGDLTMHGATNPVTIRMEKGGHVDKDPFGKERIGFEGTLIVKRSLWGMTSVVGPGTTSDDVRMTIAIEAVK